MSLIHLPSVVSAPDAAFEWDRPIPLEWVARLGQVSQPSDRLSWLELVWEPGLPDYPVQRWCLYEMIPKSAIQPDSLSELLLAECKGADPRTLPGHQATLASYRQWCLYQKTGTIGQWMWVIQGNHGGNLIQHSQYEQNMLAAEGLPPNPPPPGSQPYAPFDERVVTRIIELDRIMAFAGTFETYKRNRTEGWRELAQSKEEEFRKRRIKWLMGHMGEAAEYAGHAMKRGQDMPRATPEMERTWKEYGEKAGIS